MRKTDEQATEGLKKSGNENPFYPYLARYNRQSMKRYFFTVQRIQIISCHSVRQGLRYIQSLLFRIIEMVEKGHTNNRSGEIDICMSTDWLALISTLGYAK